MTRLLRFAVALAVAYAALCALAYVFQRRLLYFPDRSAPPLPAGPAWTGLEELRVPTGDGLELTAYWWPADDAGAGALLVLHGNAGNRGGRIEWMRRLRRELGVGVCVLDYRGYGGNPGSPSERGLVADAEAAARAVGERSEGPLFVLGESLGGGVAVQLAERHPAAGLVLQSTFRSAASVGQAAYPFLPVGLLMKDRFEVEARLDRLELPILVVHGTRDALIPLSHGEALAARAGAPLVRVEGAGHEDVVATGGASYFEALRSFLARCREES